MENKQVILPDGWTYYAYRTNTIKWKENPFDQDVIKVKGIMSVVTENEIYDELRHYGKQYKHAYSFGGGEPFEIRCLICDLKHVNEMNNSELKNIMLKEFYYDRRNFGGCYGQRHHSIPPEEELLVLGIGNHDEVFDREEKIIWTIPRRFVDFYESELKNNSPRIIDIQKENQAQK